MNIRVLYFVINRALDGMRQNWQALFNNAMIILTALCLFGIFAWAYLNITSMVGLWVQRTNVSIFLQPTLLAEQRHALLKTVNSIPIIQSAKLVSPREGIDSLTNQLGIESMPLNDLYENSLPYTIDFRVSASNPRLVLKLIKQWRALPEVSDVIYSDSFFKHIRPFFALVKIAGSALFGMALFIIYLLISNSTQLSFYARMKEIEILNFMGASRNVIRFSFTLESLLLILLTSGIGLGILWGLYQGLEYLLNSFPNFPRHLIKLQFFNQEMIWTGLGACYLVSILSSLLAVDKLWRKIQAN